MGDNADVVQQAYGAFATGDIPSLLDLLAVDLEGMDEIGADLVAGVVRGHGTRRGGGPDEYGAVHVFTVSEGKISRFRKYVDLDAPLG